MQTIEHLDVYNKIMEFVLSGNGGLLLLYGYGGTKKTFTLKTLIVNVICKGLIVFNIVSS